MSNLEILGGPGSGRYPKGSGQNPSLKAWFGESKVVDERGQPLVVYHRGSFDERDEVALEVGPEGMHFGTKNAADARPSGKTVDDQIKSLKLDQDEDGRWHWSMDGVESYDLDEQGFESESAARGDAERIAISMGENDEWDDRDIPLTEAYLRLTNPMRVEDQAGDWSKAVAKAKSLGHDGIIYRNQFEDKGSTSYIVFEPTQVKSTKSKGFDPKNPLITLGGPGSGRYPKGSGQNLVGGKTFAQRFPKGMFKKSDLTGADLLLAQSLAELTEDPNRTLFILPDGRRVGTTNPYLLHVEVAGGRLNSVLDGGVIRYSRGEGIETRVIPTHEQAQVIADDFKHHWKTRVFIDANDGQQGNHERIEENRLSADGIRNTVKRLLETKHYGPRWAGGAGSGNYGHAGRPGAVGGSVSRGQQGMRWAPPQNPEEWNQEVLAMSQDDPAAHPIFVMGLDKKLEGDTLRYVAAYGERFTAAPLPKGVAPGVPQECFKNATIAVLQNPEYTYAEGFAQTEKSGGIAFLHGWAVDGVGNVIDPTYGDEGHSYFGVKYDRTAYLKQLYKAKFFGVVAADTKTTQKAVSTGAPRLRAATMKTLGGPGSGRYPKGSGQNPQGGSRSALENELVERLGTGNSPASTGFVLRDGTRVPHQGRHHHIAAGGKDKLQALLNEGVIRYTRDGVEVHAPISEEQATLLVDDWLYYDSADAHYIDVGNGAKGKPDERLASGVFYTSMGKITPDALRGFVGDTLAGKPSRFAKKLKGLSDSRGIDPSDQSEPVGANPTINTGSGAGQESESFSEPLRDLGIESTLHTVAEFHEPKFSIAFRYAFARARKALKRSSSIDAGIAAMTGALEEVLPKMLQKVAAGGGEVAVRRLQKQMRAAGGPGSGRYPKGSGQNPQSGGFQPGDEDIWDDATRERAIATGLDRADLKLISRWAYGNAEDDADLADPSTAEGKQFDELLDRLPDHEGVTYRGIGMTRAEAARLGAGDVLPSKGRAVSATTDEDHALNMASINIDGDGAEDDDRTVPVVLKIITDGGKSIAPFTPVDWQEGEVIFRGGHFKPTGVMQEQKTADYHLPFQVVEVTWVPSLLRGAADFFMRFDAQNPSVIEWAKRHAGELIAQITETTRERIRLAITELQEGGDWDFAHDRITAAVGDVARADLIARHETMLAAGEGQRLGWEQAEEAGLLSGKERREWIITGDERTCPICSELDGKTAPLNGTYPGGYDGPPAHVMCRCTEGIA